MTTAMRLEHLRVDADIQPRVCMDPATVRDYAERMLAGDAFPPPVVFFDGAEYWLTDGHHRVQGAREAGLETLECDVREGDRDDAALYAAGANLTHGLRRSNEDKGRAVLAVLANPKSRDWKTARIARHCGVTERTVYAYRHPESRKISEFPNGTSGHPGAAAEPNAYGSAALQPPDYDADSPYRCLACGEFFPVSVWHCECVEGGYHAADGAPCKDCDGRRGTRRLADYVPVPQRDVLQAANLARHAAASEVLRFHGPHGEADAVPSPRSPQELADEFLAARGLPSLPRQPEEMAAFYRLWRASFITRFEPQAVVDAIRPDRRADFAGEMDRFMAWLQGFRAALAAAPAGRLYAVEEES